MLGPLVLAVAVVAQVGGSKSEWKPFASPKGQYTVSMPAKPVEKRRVLAISGKTVDLVTSSARKGVASYSAAYADLGGADPEVAMKAARDDVISQTRGELKEEAPATLGDNPGRELSIEIPKKVVAGGAAARARIYVVGGRLYTLVATVPAARADAMADEVNGFFDSFRPTGMEGEAKATVATTEKPAASPGRTAAVAKSKDAAMATTGLGPLAALNPFFAKPPAPPQDAGNAQAPPAKLGPEWKDVAGSDGSCVAKFRGAPNKQNVKVDSPLGPFEVQIIVSKEGNSVLMLTMTPTRDRPAGMDSATYLRGAKTGFLQSQNARLVSEKDLEIDGLPGVELVCEVPQGPKMPIPNGAVVTARLYVVKENLASISTVTPKGTDPSPNAAAFLDSFRITANGQAATVK